VLDPLPADPVVDPFFCWSELVELDPVPPCVALPLDDVPAPLWARAGTPVSSRPAMPRPATTPHPIRFMNYPLFWCFGPRLDAEARVPRTR
jgi:hypothetical protein